MFRNVSSLQTQFHNHLIMSFTPCLQHCLHFLLILEHLLLRRELELSAHDSSGPSCLKFRKHRSGAAGRSHREKSQSRVRQVKRKHPLVDRP